MNFSNAVTDLMDFCLNLYSGQWVLVGILSSPLALLKSDIHNFSLWYRYYSLTVVCCQIQLCQFGTDAVGCCRFIAWAWTAWFSCICSCCQLQTDVNVSRVAFFHIFAWNLSPLKTMSCRVCCRFFSHACNVSVTIPSIVMQSAFL